MALLSVAVSAGFKPAYLELAPKFASRNGIDLQTSLVPSTQLADHLKTHPQTDAVIAAKIAVIALAGQAVLASDSIVDLASTGIGAAVRSGWARPDMTSKASLREALLAANSIGCSTGPSGDHLLRLFEELEVASVLAPKLIKTTNSVADLLLQGRIELGFQQISELRSIGGIEYVGSLQ